MHDIVKDVFDNAGYILDNVIYIHDIVENKLHLHPIADSRGERSITMPKKRGQIPRKL